MPVVSLAFMEGVSPYRNSKCANLRIPLQPGFIAVTIVTSQLLH